MNFVGISAMTYVMHPVFCWNLAEHVGANIAEHELCIAQIHAEHHIHTYKLIQGV
jgi:hypothetical protein